MNKIRISSGNVSLTATLDSSKTADLIWNALPIRGRIQTWGDEIYFSIPVSASIDETAAEVVEKGSVAYWPPGNALCLFWGPTPASRGDEIRPASPVNVFGMIDGDPNELGNALAGSEIRIEAV
jgi:hypothetical protein